MTEAAQTPLTTGTRSAHGAALAMLGLVIIGLGVFFADGIASLGSAWAKPEYSHGPLIPLIAVYLMLREMRIGGFGQAQGSRVPGFFVFAFGALVGLLGNLTQIPYFITYGLIIAIGGLILILAGHKRGLKFWAAWLYLVFMLPLPTAIYWQVSTQLQFLSSRLGVEVIKLLGIPVFLDGNVIDLGVYKLQVAEACSGLRYLFPLASFGFLFAALYQGPFWHKVLLFLSSLPITVAMNSFRIGVIGILVNYFGIEQAEGFLHLFEGWIIFVACMALLFFEANILQRFTAQPKSVLQVLDLDWSGLGGPIKSLFKVDANKWLAAAAVLSVVAGAGWTIVPKSQKFVPEHKPLAIFPLEIKDWKGTEIRNEKETEIALGADDYLSVNFVRNGSQEAINFFTAFYESTSDGSGIHNPEICIPGGGWEVAKWQRVYVKFDDPSRAPLQVNRAVIRKGNERRLVYYWFEMRGQRFVSEYRAKFQTIIDSITKSRADGALVRFITPLSASETEGDADARLAGFMPAILDELPAYVPP